MNDESMQEQAPGSAPEEIAPPAWEVRRKSRLPLVIGIVVLVLLLAAAGGFFAVRGAESSAIEAGKASLQAGDWAAAEASFTRAIQTQPAFVLARQAEAVALRAEANYQLERYDQALADAETGLAQAENAALRLIRARIFFEQGKMADALDEAEIVQELDDTQGFPYALQAYQLYRKYKFDESLAAAQAALERDDSLQLAYRVRGSIAAWMEDPDAAQIDLEKALALDPDDVEAMAMLGYAYGSLYQGDDLAKITERAQKAGPSTPAALWVSALNALWNYDHDLALDFANQAITADPTRAEYYLARVEAYTTTAQEKDALADLDKGLSIAPKLAMLLAGKAFFLYGISADQDYEAVASQIEAAAPKSISGLHIRALYALKAFDFEKAKTLANEMIARRPERTSGYSMMAEIAIIQYDAALAEENIIAGLKLDPHSSRMYRLQGSMFAIQRKMDESIAAMEKALELDPDTANVHAALALSYLGNRDKDAARAELETAKALDPQNPGMLIAEAWMASDDGDLKRAIEISSAAVEVHPNDALPYLLRGKFYLIDGNRSLAQADAKKVLELVADHPGAYLLLGSVYGMQEQWDKAIEAYEKAIAANRYMPDAYAMMGMAYGAKNDLEQAAENLQKSLDLQPDQVSLYNALGMTQLDLGRFEDAQQSLEKYLELGEDEPGETLDRAESVIKFLKSIPLLVNGQRVYNDEETGFAITVPEKWWPLDDDIGINVKLLLNNKEIGGDNLISLAMAGDTPATILDGEITPQILVQQLEQQYQAIFPGFQKISNAEIKGTFLEGSLLKFTFTVDRKQRTGWVAVFVRAPRYALFELFIDSEVFEAAEKDALEMVKTFNFLP